MARKNTSGVRNRKRREHLIALGKTCAQCGTRDDLTLDHIKPLAKGGTNAWENLQLLCDHCNHRKGHG